LVDDIQDVKLITTVEHGYTRQITFQVISFFFSSFFDENKINK